ncbi:Uncharacterized protein APZ42_001873 [Daphnia magna]|uniref:Uncharacterized protein n=1 Tax=Daphnia magna TaxID=35525 RepID=A0A162C6H7_9CRUS|nr:Uncharacterized protein APZ42_001873 [Daphnia magna]
MKLLEVFLSAHVGSLQALYLHSLSDSVVLHLKSQRNGASDDGILIDGGKKLNFILWVLKIVLNIFNYFSNNPSKCRSFFTLINNYSKMGENSG